MGKNAQRRKLKKDKYHQFQLSVIRGIPKWIASKVEEMRSRG